MLPFFPFPILLITLNTMLVAYSEIFFLSFTYRRSQDFYFRQVSLVGIFFGEIITSPPVIIQWSVR